MRLTILSVVFVFCSAIHAQKTSQEASTVFKYRVSLTDKNNNGYSIDKPEMFLSEKSIERRKRYNIQIDETDLPVTEAYVKKIAQQGVGIVHKSKWNNTVVVQTRDSFKINKVRALDFVKGVELVAVSLPNKQPDPGRKNLVKAIPEDLDSARVYGISSNQFMQIRGNVLHMKGFKGKGMTIAITDGGFSNVDIIPCMKNIDILGSRDFVNPKDDMFAEHDHGTKVLSCMGMNTKNIHIGTAPEASYWLIRTEDTHTEQPVEQDNWIAGVEFADSVGVDIINASIGYFDFDNPHKDVKYWELDGKTHIISRTASMLASKGIILCNSAGNEGNKSWKKICIPADASDILTVGAVGMNGAPTWFTSVGNSEDGRIKPDICALGDKAGVIDNTGYTSTASGTSFASPILCGMVACLWQAFPELNAYEIMDIVRQSGNYAEHPNNVYGYGIANFKKAYDLGKQKVNRSR